MLSVIVPVMNEEGNISRFLQVLGLSSQYICEILVVDGGSTDQTLEIAAKYPKVICLTSYVDREYGARNDGARIAKGRYLLFLDADTLVYPEMFRRIYRAIRSGTDCLASTDTTMCDSLLLRIQSDLYNLLRLLLAKARLRFFTTGNFILIRKRVFSSLGGFEEDINGDARLGRKVIASKLSYALLNCYRYVYVSSRRAKNGVVAMNRYYFYAIENYFPSLIRFGFFKKKHDLFNSLWKKRMLG